MAQVRTWDFGEDRSTEVLNRHFSDLLPKGIYVDYDVTTNVSSLFLNIEAGILLTGEGVRIEETAALPNEVQIDAGSAQPRIDLVVCQHKFSNLNTPAAYSVIKGTPAASPVPPPVPPDYPSGSVFTQILATITVPALAAEILPGDVSLEAKTSISLTTVPFATLSDISADISDAVIGMTAPSAANVTATIADITNATFAQASIGILQVSPTSTPDDNVTVASGTIQDLRNQSASPVAGGSVGPFSTVSADSRIDLVVVDPDTQTLSIVAGVEAASPVAPAYPLDRIVLAEVLIDETVTVVVNAGDITDVRPILHRNRPELFDLPDLTSDIKDGITGAAAPAAANVFQTENDLNTALDPIAGGFTYSRVRFDTGVVVTDQTTLASGALVTCHDASFANLITVRTTGALVADGGGGVGPGGLENTGSFLASNWYHIYLIAQSTGSAPDFGAALVISTSAVSPNLGGGSFTGYDIFRRLVALRTSTTPIWIPSFTAGGWTYYVDDIASPSTARLGNDFSAAPNPFSFASSVPPTSRRAEFWCGELSSPGGGTQLFITHGADTRTSTGGRRAGQDQGTGGGSGCTFFGDTDTSQRVRIRVAGGVTPPIEFALHAYQEEP
jgi:hypothetical protein